MRQLAIGVALALGTASAATAAPRKVAIVNVAADQERGARAAARIRAELDRAPDLAPVRSGDLSRALEDALGDVDVDVGEQMLAGARADADAAATSFDEFNTRDALSAISRAETRLLTVAPSPATTGLLADLVFLAGRAHLSDGKRSLALAAFALAHRLDPELAPDPVRYRPEVVAAFGAATAAPSLPPVRATISATFDGVRVFVDGKEVGTTPVVVDVAPGAHYVVLVSGEFELAGRRFEAKAGEPTALKVQLSRRSTEAVVRDVRRRVVASSSAEDARAAAQLAIRVTRVDAALVVATRDGALVAAVYDGVRDQLSALYPLGPRAADMFGLLVPTNPAAISLITPTPLTTATASRPWYRKWWGLSLAGGGVAAVVLGAVTFALTSDRPDSRTVVFDGFGRPM